MADCSWGFSCIKVGEARFSALNRVQGSATLFCLERLLFWCKVITTSVFPPRWTIRARVMNKSNIRNWSNSRGEGKLFSFEIVDESVSIGIRGYHTCFPVHMCFHVGMFGFMEYFVQQGEIKITAFNNEVDKFFSLVEQGKVSQVPSST